MILASLFIMITLMNLANSMYNHKRMADEMLLEISYVATTWESHQYDGNCPKITETQVPPDLRAHYANGRRKRIGSLSITNPMDVLKQRFLLLLARRQQMQQEEQAKANREILNDIGKRSAGYYGAACISIETLKGPVLRNQRNQLYPNSRDWSHQGKLNWHDVQNFKEKKFNFAEWNGMTRQ